MGVFDGMIITLTFVRLIWLFEAPVSRFQFIEGKLIFYLHGRMVGQKKASNSYLKARVD